MNVRLKNKTTGNISYCPIVTLQREKQCLAIV